MCEFGLDRAMCESENKFDADGIFFCECHSGAPYFAINICAGDLRNFNNAIEFLATCDLPIYACVQKCVCVYHHNLVVVVLIRWEMRENRRRDEV